MGARKILLARFFPAPTFGHLNRNNFLLLWNLNILPRQDDTKVSKKIWYWMVKSEQFRQKVQFSNDGWYLKQLAKTMILNGHGNHILAVISLNLQVFSAVRKDNQSYYQSSEELPEAPASCKYLRKLIQFRKATWCPTPCLDHQLFSTLTPLYKTRPCPIQVQK